MATFDVRTESGNIDCIVATDILTVVPVTVQDIDGNSKPAVGIRTKTATKAATIYLYDEKEIQNLILALNKANELGWFNDNKVDLP